MSEEKNVVISGDLTLVLPDSTDEFGWGDLTVERKAYINGTADATNSTDASLIVAGGIGVTKSILADLDLTIDGHSQLDQVTIDTSDAQTLVTGPNAVDISVGAASQFVSTGGNMTVSATTESVILSGGKTDQTAVQITSTNAAGGIQIQSGATGTVGVSGGSGGLTVDTLSGGAISLDAIDAASNFTIATSGAAQNLSLGITGATDSQVVVESSGTSATGDAIVVNTTNTAGNIRISNSAGLAEGGAIDVLSGSDGMNLTTNTSGTLNILAQGASGSFIVNSDGAGEHLTISQSGTTDSSLILESAGINTSNTAVDIKTNNTAGNIALTNAAAGTGSIDMSTGTGGLSGITQDGGPVSLTSVGATTSITASTNASGQDLILQVVGATDSSVVVQSSGTGTDAIKLDSTAGGIRADATGIIQIETTDTTNGINLASSTAGVPVNIGTTSSLTTVYGNFDVLGTTTSIESVTLTVDDNIVFVNNAPSGTSDGGIAVKRFQSANDTASGDVIADPAVYTGTAQGGGINTITLDAGASTTNDIYAGYWVEITTGTGASQVRRIKSYDGTTKIATLYSTADQTGVLGNPTPVEGLDYTTNPDATSVFELHDCGYVVSVWDESAKEWIIACTSLDPSDNVVINGYADFHAGDATFDNITATTINNLTADSIITVTLTDNSTANVICTGFPTDYGIYIVIARPDTLFSTRPSAIFMIGRLNDGVTAGDSNRYLSVRGSTNSQLRMNWPSGSKPQLRYGPAPGV
ncbi:hypothetical protein SAGO17_0073 [Mimivirus AB-566-O17]|uniref:Uncharacterized protein n=1 Tax=Mimivirus AB-566-O17 TaxID=1988039 RepID=A0A1X9VNT2_9VIRU|nr:hypothetical protein SAGO17_0073 [Mimivirus AB-566-O17]